MFETIVLAADPFGHADVALPLTCEIARKFEGEVVVLLVRDVSGPLDERHCDAVAVTERFADALTRDGVSVRMDVRGARGQRIGQEIATVAHELGAGLVVVGTRGLSPLASVMLGSVSHQVQRFVDCPVLVARY